MRQSQRSIRTKLLVLFRQRGYTPKWLHAFPHMCIYIYIHIYIYMCGHAYQPIFQKMWSPLCACIFLACFSWHIPSAFCKKTVGSESVDWTSCHLHPSQTITKGRAFTVLEPQLEYLGAKSKRAQCMPLRGLSYARKHTRIHLCTCVYNKKKKCTYVHYVQVRIDAMYVLIAIALGSPTSMPNRGWRQGSVLRSWIWWFTSQTPRLTSKSLTQMNKRQV